MVLGEATDAVGAAAADPARRLLAARRFLLGRDSRGAEEEGTTEEETDDSKQGSEMAAWAEQGAHGEGEGEVRDRPAHGRGFADVPKTEWKTEESRRERRGGLPVPCLSQPTPDWGTYMAASRATTGGETCSARRGRGTRPKAHGMRGSAAKSRCLPSLAKTQLSCKPRAAQPLVNAYAITRVDIHQGSHGREPPTAYRFRLPT